MLARVSAVALSEWQAFYQVEAEDELEADAQARAQAGVAQATPLRGPRPRGA